MNNISLILAAVFMIFNFCGSTMSAPPPSPAEEEPALIEESFLPDSEPAIVPEAVPESPVPSPTEAKGSIFDLIANGSGNASPVYQVDLAAYYLEEMCTAAAKGDVKAGLSAEENRNAAIDAISSDEQKISFDDLYLLARVIFSEAGSDWLTEDFRLCVGEVVLNRVASPEYPDSIYDVVYQKGQYTGVNTVKFANLKPGEDCVKAALMLLQGERRMAPAVVYQSDCIQGELFSMYSDRRLGNTYFCLSPNLELYPIE